MRAQSFVGSTKKLYNGETALKGRVNVRSKRKINFPLGLSMARCVLAGQRNPLRLNFFSTAMRILLERMIGHAIAKISGGDVFGSSLERVDGKPTRGQRVLFAIQGELGDLLKSG